MDEKTEDFLSELITKLDDSEVKFRPGSIHEQPYNQEEQRELSIKLGDWKKDATVKQLELAQQLLTKARGKRKEYVPYDIEVLLKTMN